ncbi:MAG TPA: ABC transporter ATP-binding protein [Desulfobacteraceae bacterium]|nr:ABC transporter ATP-binding protein [Desulfobacteraceae bacterium]
MENNKIILEVKGVSKSFGGVKAVEDVSLYLKRGEVLGIIGPNGSGKTTLVNLITGFLRPDSGKINFKGIDITGKSPHKIANMGLTRTFQIMRPYHSLSAYKNLIIPLNAPRVRESRSGKFGDTDAVAIDILEELGFERDARVPYKSAGTLPLGYLKRLELGRCLALKPELIICDEIFSGLSMSEITTLIPLLERLQIQGLTLIMIEHRLRELFRLADRVCVLNFGKLIAEGDPQRVIEDPKVKEAYWGKEREKKRWGY